MMAHFRIAYRSVDLDSVEFQAGDRGGAIRAALAARTGVKTIPQIFIGGEFMGGATDLFEAWRAGRAQVLLERTGVSFDRTRAADPFGFLPGWLQPRPAA
jgi:cysteine synthase A